MAYNYRYICNKGVVTQFWMMAWNNRQEYLYKSEWNVLGWKITYHANSNTSADNCNIIHTTIGASLCNICAVIYFLSIQVWLLFIFCRYSIFTSDGTKSDRYFSCFFSFQKFNRDNTLPDVLFILITLKLSLVLKIRSNFLIYVFSRLFLSNSLAGMPLIKT